MPSVFISFIILTDFCVYMCSYIISHQDRNIKVYDSIVNSLSHFLSFSFFFTLCILKVLLFIEFLFRIVMSSWWTDNFIIMMKCTFLSLLISLYLKSILSVINKATPIFLCLVYIFQSFYFSSCLMCIFCKQHIVGPCFPVSGSLCPSAAQSVSGLQKPLFSAHLPFSLGFPGSQKVLPCFPGHCGPALPGEPSTFFSHLVGCSHTFYNKV